MRGSGPLDAPLPRPFGGNAQKPPQLDAPPMPPVFCNDMIPISRTGGIGGISPMTHIPMERHLAKKETRCPVNALRLTKRIGGIPYHKNTMPCL